MSSQISCCWRKLWAADTTTTKGKTIFGYLLVSETGIGAGMRFPPPCSTSCASKAQPTPYSLKTGSMCVTQLGLSGHVMEGTLGEGKMRPLWGSWLSSTNLKGCGHPGLRARKSQQSQCQCHRNGRVTLEATPTRDRVLIERFGSYFVLRSQDHQATSFDGNHAALRQRARGKGFGALGAETLARGDPGVLS